MNMTAYQSLAQPALPTVLSMEVDDEDSFESEYRVRIGNQIKYIIISPRAFDRDTLSFPLQSLSSLPWEDEYSGPYFTRRNQR